MSETCRRDWSRGTNGREPRSGYGSGERRKRSVRLISAAGADKAFVHSPLHGERFRRRASESGDRATRTRSEKKKRENGRRAARGENKDERIEEDGRKPLEAVEQRRREGEAVIPRAAKGAETKRSVPRFIVLLRARSSMALRATPSCRRYCRLCAINK